MKRVRNYLVCEIIILFIMSFVLSGELFFAFSILMLAYLLLKRSFIMEKLRVPGLRHYIFILIFLTVFGLARYSSRLVFRDVYYEFLNIILIIIGCLLYKKVPLEKIVFTVFSCMGILTLFTTINALFVFAGGVSFSSFRESFALGIKGIESFFSIFVIWIFVFKKTIISKRIDKAIVILWGVQAILNLSRTTLLGIVLTFFASVLVLKNNNKISKKKFVRIISLIVVSFVVLMFVTSFLPDDIWERFIGKVYNSFSEINNRQIYNSLSDANSNWRGYEIQQAINQWKKANILAQIFGLGNGTLIGLTYIPDLWNKIMESQNGISGVTVLHNTYFTLLIKGGIVTVFSFIVIFVQGIRKAFISIKKSISDEDIFCSIMLLCLNITMILDAYVTRGMFQNDPLVFWGIVYGWINNEVYYEIVRGNFDDER